MPNKRIHLCLAHMSGNEQKFIDEAFRTNWVVPCGPNVDGFEKDLEEFFSVENVVALCSGTASTHLALLAAGVGKDDEVLVQSLCFVAAANPVKYVGATPVFIDSEPYTWNMSPELLEEAIIDRKEKTGKYPKAIIVVDLFGMPAMLNEIVAIANKYDIILIEDAANAFGSKYDGKMCGTFGRFGVLSFNGNKMITTSGGGALICPDAEAKNKIMWYATQAREAYPYYQHEAIGYNYRLSNICAGIGRGQMTVANEHIEHHRHIADLYRKAFQEIEGITFHDEPQPHPQPLSGGEGSSDSTENNSLSPFGNIASGYNSPSPLERGWGEAENQNQSGWDEVSNQPHPQPLSTGEGNGVDDKNVSAPFSFGEGSGERLSGVRLWQTANPSVYKSHKDFSRENRKNQTEAENALWQALRNNKLGYKFRRQHCIDNFVVDFVCLEKNLTIEVDGGYHNDSVQVEYDMMRTQLLNELGYSELRFKNEEVLDNIDKVLSTIKNQLSKSPSPLERGWGEADQTKRGWGEFRSNYWLCTILLDPSIKIKGQENAYGKAVTGAVGGAAGVVHQAASITTDCQPNDNVEALRMFMDAAGIEARPLWKPMHKQPVYHDCPAYTNGVSEALFKCGMCLPSGPCVTDDDVRYIVDKIKEAIE